MKEKQPSNPNEALAKPLPFAIFRAPAIFPGTRPTEIRHFQEILQEKLDALCRSYDVSPEEVNRHHALILAQRHIRAFNSTEGSGVRTHTKNGMTFD
jgi:hypothetical protein